MRWILRNVDHRRLTAVPSGETRDPNWVVTIFDGLDRDPNLRTIKRNRFIQRGYLGAPLYTVRRGREFRPELPYAARAGVEYAVFQRLSAELQLADTLPQYGIPHPLDLASFAFWLAAPRHLDAFIDATQQQVLAIHHLTGGRVQYQIETPVSLILATATVGQKIVIAWLAKLTQRLLATMPPGARVVVHLCAGDLGHKAMILIFTLGPAVKLANAIADTSPMVTAIHLPLGAGHNPPPSKRSFYRALRGLRLGPAQLIAGLAHEGQPLDRQAHALRWADDAFGQPIPILSHPCGLGRRSAEAAQRAMDRLTELGNL